ncbi:MAG TPA: hypothetical protein VNN17_13265, partial [Terriglobia bacterium]|nr:hypothetical protein [Terriglobia bacterium]
ISDSDPVNYYGLIRRVSVNGTITTVVPPSPNGLSDSGGLAVDAAGNLYASDYWNNRVVRVNPDGSLTTVAGGGPGGGFPDENVPATSTTVVGPTGIVFDAAGNLYISEEGWDIVRRVDQAGVIRTFAGTLDVLDNGPALTAPLSTPRGLASDATGRIYVADTFHNRIRRINLDGSITTVAGTGEPASNATAVFYPESISLDAAGNLYFAEPGQSTVSWRSSSDGQLRFLAGVVDQFGYNGDNISSTQAHLNSPRGVLSDASGVVYIADHGNHCIRKVDLTNTITRVAGICTQAGYSGDGGPALQALMDSPTGLAFDADGNLLVSDLGNSIVRRINLSTGIITRVAGIPQQFGYSGDGGPPTQAALGQPTGLAVDRNNGNIYIADRFYSVVRIIRGNSIYTLTGVGEDGFFGDGGQAKFAYLNSPEALALDPAGNLHVLDTHNNRVRKITLAGLQPPTLSVSPASLSFHVAANGEPPPSQFLRIRNTGSGFLNWDLDLRLPPDGSGTFTGGGWLYAVDFSGSAPSLNEISVDPSGVAPGTYQGQIVINSPGANNGRVIVPITLTVDAALEPVMALSTETVYFEAVQGTTPSARILSVTNRGSGTLNWSASVDTFNGGNWLALSRTSGSVQAGGAASAIAITGNPAGLAPGFYLGIVTVMNLGNGSESYVVVGLSVTAPTATILPSASSFVFYAVQGSNYVPSQTARILNTGQGVMNWQVQTSVAQGNWLRVTPASGSSDAANLANAPAITVSVDPVGLAPGTYGGYLSIQSPGARNTPQLANVILRILPPGSAPIAQVLPTGLAYTATTGSAPQTQEVTLQTTGGSTLNFVVGTRTQEGGNWLTASPTAGSLTSSSDRPRIRIQAAPGALAPGVYRGAVTVSFSDGTLNEIAVALIVREPGAITQGFGGVAQGCSPNQQVILSTRLGNNFALPTGWPSTVLALVTDNCGQPVNNSTVVASFNNGDGSIVLQNQGSGVYSKEWVPSRGGGSSSVQMTIRAVNPVLPEAVIQVVGSLLADNTNPVVASSGIVNGASFAANRPLAPGSIVSIFGNDLASTGQCFGGNCASTVPLPTSLGGVSVRIGGYNAPLFYASPTQLNVQIPAELTNVASADVVVAARGVVSAPASIQLDASQPGIFTIDGTRGAVLISNTDTLAAATGSVPGRNARPANRGEFITIYCSGLGPVNDPPPSGSPATANPLSRTLTPVSVSIGGVVASNVSFSGLSPGFVGLYQVDVPVPANAPTGDAVPVKLIQNGVESNVATIAIQ